MLTRKARMNTPIVPWDDLVQTSGTRRVGCLAPKLLAEGLSAEEDPVVLVSGVECSLELLNGRENGREVIFVNERDERCTRVLVGGERKKT